MNQLKGVGIKNRQQLNQRANKLSYMVRTKKYDDENSNCSKK